MVRSPCHRLQSLALVGFSLLHCSENTVGSSLVILHVLRDKPRVESSGAGPQSVRTCGRLCKNVGHCCSDQKQVFTMIKGRDIQVTVLELQLPATASPG